MSFLHHIARQGTTRPGRDIARPLLGAAVVEYADGKPVREGDWVRTDQGQSLGRVTAVVDASVPAQESKVQGSGVVVDAPPRGVVFLSNEYLREDPLQFVRRGPGENSRSYLSLALGAGALLLIPALYSLLSGIYSALTTGEVLVVSVGRTETYRTLVPWRAGWARFVGPLLLLLSFVASDGSRGSTLRWWLCAVGTLLGLTLLAFSSWFISVNSTLAFVGISGFIFVAAQVDAKFGRCAAIALLVTCVAWFLCQPKYVHAATQQEPRAHSIHLRAEGAAKPHQHGLKSCAYQQHAAD